MNKLILLLTFPLFAVGIVYGAYVAPQATLRIATACQSIGGPETIPAGTVVPKCYLVEVYVPESLNREAYTATKSGAGCRDHSGAAAPCRELEFARLFDGKSFFDLPFEISPNDGQLTATRQFRLFAIYLPSDFDVSKSLKVVFDPYFSRAGAMRFAAIDAGRDTKIEFEYDHYKRKARQKVQMNKYSISCADDLLAEKLAFDAKVAATANPGDAKLQVKAVETRATAEFVKLCNEDARKLEPAYSQLIQQRMTFLESWLNTQTSAKVETRFEDLSTCIELKGKGCISSAEWVSYSENIPWPSVTPGNWQQNAREYHQFFATQGFPLAPLANPPTQAEFTRLTSMFKNYVQTKRAELAGERQLKVADLQVNAISNLRTWSSATARLLITEFSLQREFPAKFSFQLIYANSVPMEIGTPLRVLSQEIGKIIANPKEDAGEVAKRERPNRLDASVLFSTTVGIKEETVNNAVVKTIDRTTRGTLDLRLSPFRLVEHDRWFRWEPVFVDAKVSTGKITSETLSVNRVVIGTRFDFTKYIDTKNKKNPSYLNFAVKPVQASDRDFKQLEYKLIGEFEPRISFLNRVPEDNVDTYDRALLATGDKEPTLFFPSPWGYKLAPVVGGEIGKTWLRRRPVEAIEPTNFIRRIYAGVNMTFYAPRNVSLTITDRFYWSFGKDRNRRSVDSQENHFKATLDFGLRRKSGFGDSIFFSFVKGNEPPFGARDDNTFKIGYRFINPSGLLFW